MELRGALFGAVLIAAAFAIGCRSLGFGSSAPSSAALAAAPRAVPADGWKTSVAEDQPLVGRIWDTGGARFLSENELFARLATSRFVLLGEKHDNPDHHRLEALVVRRLTAAGRRPAVAFEMLKRDRAPALARVLAKPRVTPEDVRRAVDWDRSGWPAWRLYEPVFAAVLDAHLPIVAANLSDRILARIGHHGVDALDAATRSRLDLDRALPPKQRAAMADEIRDAHCGYAPERALPLMVDVQRARDGALAAALEVAATRPQVDGAVLVAGNGHVRRDRGVPWHLTGAGVPANAVVSVAFLEVPAPAAASNEAAPGTSPSPSEGSSQAEPAAPVTDPARDLEESFGSARAFDYVWYTPRVEAIDPCAQFRRELEHMRHMKLPPRGPSAGRSRPNSASGVTAASR